MIKIRNCLLALLAVLQVASATKYYNILDYGAYPDTEEIFEYEYYNSEAFYNAIADATNHTYGEHIVLIPEGYTFSMMPVNFEWMTDVTIQIDGTIKASKRHTRYHIRWENRGGQDWRGHVDNFFQFDHALRVKFQGKGTVDGQGFMWWMREYIVNNPGGRPHLIEMNHSEDVEFTGITWKNSPQYNINVRDINNFWFHDFTIQTDIKGQWILGQFFGQHDTTQERFTMVTFPLNTDGIDPAGTNVLIERINIINFDDAVAVKPQDNRGEKAICSENIMVRNCNITYGVGMTIGSVPPHDEYNCVRNVTFINHTFYHPFKAIYVKTNPGHTTSMLPGSGGEITNIRYENIEIHWPIWWSIYIGPQQQKQPDGAGPGCMFYPFGGLCETQPLINMQNITLKNVKQYHNILPPGVIRCNETLQCGGFEFEDVSATGWWKLFGFNYITENIYGTVKNSHPAPDFKEGEPDGIPSKPFDIGRYLSRRSSSIIKTLSDTVVQNNPLLGDVPIASAFMEQLKKTVVQGYRSFKN